ncbi:hypothetical protein ACIHCQ_29455 [Streptomyces sp. NPDC052236]
MNRFSRIARRRSVRLGEQLLALDLQDVEGEEVRGHRRCDVAS